MQLSVYYETIDDFRNKNVQIDWFYSTRLLSERTSCYFKLKKEPADKGLISSNKKIDRRAMSMYLVLKNQSFLNMMQIVRYYMWTYISIPKSDVIKDFHRSQSYYVLCRVPYSKIGMNY